MATLEPRLNRHIDLLLRRYPAMASIRDELIAGYLMMQESYQQGGKLLVAGNGGSAADAEHIVGELMKRFKLPRPVSPELAAKLTAIDPERGAELASSLEMGPCPPTRPPSPPSSTMWAALTSMPSSCWGTPAPAMCSWPFPPPATART